MLYFCHAENIYTASIIRSPWMCYSDTNFNFQFIIPSHSFGGNDCISVRTCFSSSLGFVVLLLCFWRWKIPPRIGRAVVNRSPPLFCSSISLGWLLSVWISDGCSCLAMFENVGFPFLSLWNPWPRAARRPTKHSSVSWRRQSWRESRCWALEPLEQCTRWDSSPHSSESPLNSGAVRLCTAAKQPGLWMGSWALGEKGCWNCVQGTSSG